MLQIVIWILCVYLVVKGFEILSNPASRTKFGVVGAAIAWIAAPSFFLLSVAQLGQTASNSDGPNGPLNTEAAPTPGSYADQNSDDPRDEKYRECLRKAADVRDAAKCDQLRAQNKL